jgi:hypothetical protein
VARASHSVSLPRRRSAALLAIAVAIPGGAGASARAQEGGVGIPVSIERCAVESRALLTDPFNSIRTNVVTGISVSSRTCGRPPQHA